MTSFRYICVHQSIHFDVLSVINFHDQPEDAKETKSTDNGKEDAEDKISILGARVVSYIREL